jgi:hypothetical protein
MGSFQSADFLVEVGNNVACVRDRTRVGWSKAKGYSLPQPTETLTAGSELFCALAQFEQESLERCGHMDLSLRLYLSALEPE